MFVCSQHYNVGGATYDSGSWFWWNAWWIIQAMRVLIPPVSFTTMDQTSIRERIWRMRRPRVTLRLRRGKVMLGRGRRCIILVVGLFIAKDRAYVDQDGEKGNHARLRRESRLEVGRVNWWRSGLVEWTRPAVTTKRARMRWKRSRYRFGAVIAEDQPHNVWDGGWENHAMVRHEPRMGTMESNRWRWDWWSEPDPALQSGLELV